MRILDTYEHPYRTGARAAILHGVTARAVDSKKAMVEYCGTDDSEDRYGSVIDPSGWETEAYMRAGHGVVLWAHNYSMLPVGRTIKLTKTNKSLNFTVEFAVFNEFGRQVYESVINGFLPGVSVGFIPKTSESYKAQTVPSGVAENTRYTRQELLELSIVPVPANRNSLLKAYSLGRMSDATVDALQLRGFMSGGPLPFPMRRVEPEWSPSPESIRKIEAILGRRTRGR